MISKEKIERINELSKKSKEIGLNEIEKEEQKKLRKEYIDAVKLSLKSQLDNIEIID
ncbi:MAG: DUF896 domain-containing protein [Andreesenia angusta]|nr:DUF896 domain-containing protein [Andreesenia angusta]